MLASVVYRITIQQEHPKQRSYFKNTIHDQYENYSAKPCHCHAVSSAKPLVTQQNTAGKLEPPGYEGSSQQALQSSRACKNPSEQTQRITPSESSFPPTRSCCSLSLHVRLFLCLLQWSAVSNINQKIMDEGWVNFFVLLKLVTDINLCSNLQQLQTEYLKLVGNTKL